MLFITLNHSLKLSLTLIDKQAKVINLFLLSFKFTNNDEDYIACCEIGLWNKEVKSGIGDTKLAIEIAEYARKNKFGNVVAKNKKIDKKSVRCWFGIAMVGDE